jgi:hypothetical protein
MSELQTAKADKRDAEQAILAAALAREKELLAEGWVPAREFTPKNSGMSYSLDENLERQPISYPHRDEQLAAAIQELEDEDYEVEVIPGVTKVQLSEYWETKRMADALHTTNFRWHGPRPFPKIPLFENKFYLTGDGEPQNGAFLYKRKKPTTHPSTSENQ